jgi:hypothetical protein
VLKIQKDPLYDEPVNIEIDPEEGLKILLQIEICENEAEKD